MRVDFLDDKNFIIYCIYDGGLKTEEEMKKFFKMLNSRLKKRYAYEFEGIYDVDIFCKNNVFILVFKNIDDFGEKDFNITMYINSTLLYEFEDFEFFLGKKIFYNDKYYIELDSVVDDIRLFEFGNIIYGNKVEEVLRQGILIWGDD